MIEEQLINFGVLGIWTLSLLYEKYKQNTKTQTVIEANTAALIEIKDVLANYKKKSI